MELAARNASLAGRELSQEIIERDALSEEPEPLQARNPRAAFVSRELDHLDYRTPVEQANWLNQQSQSMRDLYEHGAEVKGDVLIVPAEEYELSEERDTPFITTLSYALQRIGDREQAREFHALGLAIGGETADARTQIAVFKTYYDRITRGERDAHFRKGSEAGRVEAFAQTLAEMRLIAAEMARLETRESLEAPQIAEDRKDEVPEGRLNTAARRVNLRDESLRLPAGLSYEQKERLISSTIQEIDYRLERGVSRAAIFKAIDSSVFRPDPNKYANELAKLSGKPEDEHPERAVSKEEYLESQQTLLKLCEQEHLHLRGLKAAHNKNELESHEEARLNQVDSLARRLRQELGRSDLDAQSDRAAQSRLFVSLSNRGEEMNAVRLPVSSVKVYETMTKIAAGERLSLQTWAGQKGREVKLELTEREAEERSRIGAFLKNYVDERLRDPETRALNTSAVFRDARAAIFNATTPEVLGRVAADLLRVNERRSEEMRRHRAAPENYPPPSVTPLNTAERNLLFNGRAPDHHSPEMRELRLSYGLSRRARADRVAGLREGRIEPSEALGTLLQELETRKTAKAVAHFQAGLLNEKMSYEGRVNLQVISQRIPPHERTFLYEFCEERKRALQRAPSARQSEVTRDEGKVAESPTTRAFGAMPRESRTFREYMASMGQIERRLLNEALAERGIELAKSDARQEEQSLTITQARALLPESLQREVRLRARNLAWQSLVPEEVFHRNASPETVKINDTIAYIQDQLQERARVAQNARHDFVAEKIGFSDQVQMADGAATRATNGEYEKFIQARSVLLAPADRRGFAELDHYAAQTREDVYRAFELLDAQRRELELARPHNQRHFAEVKVFPASTSLQAERLPASFPMHREIGDATVQFPGIQSGKLLATISLTRRIESDREWHVDSLREVFNPELGKLPNELHEREDQLSQQTDYDFAREH